MMDLTRVKHHIGNRRGGFLAFGDAHPRPLGRTKVRMKRADMAKAPDRNPVGCFWRQRACRVRRALEPVATAASPPLPPPEI